MKGKESRWTFHFDEEIIGYERKDVYPGNKEDRIYKNLVSNFQNRNDEYILPNEYYDLQQFPRILSLVMKDYGSSVEGSQLDDLV